MNKNAGKEPLMNSLARTVGHAAGTIARATHELAANAAGMVQSDEKPKRAEARRTGPQKKKRAATPPSPKKRKRKPRKTK